MEVPMLLDVEDPAPLAAPLLLVSGWFYPPFRWPGGCHIRTSFGSGELLLDTAFLLVPDLGCPLSIQAGRCLDRRLPGHSDPIRVPHPVADRRLRCVPAARPP